MARKIRPHVAAMTPDIAEIRAPKAQRLLPKNSNIARRTAKMIFNSTLVVFALIGFGFVGVYASVNLHLTNTDGIVDRQADVFWQNAKSSGQTADAIGATGIGTPGIGTSEVNTGTATGTGATSTDSFFNSVNYCRMKALKSGYSGTFFRILDLASHGDKDLANNNLNVAMATMGTTTEDNSSNDPQACESSIGNSVTRQDFTALTNMVDDKELFIFATSTEWAFFKQGVLKDAATIKKVESVTGIKSRILVAELVAEQMRLFYSSRGWFEKAISPVKVLASMSQFSWGVLGIKEATAEAVEKNLKNISSDFYLGPQYESLLDFSTPNVSQERFKRITDYKDHYYGYLYAALFNKEIEAQWQKKGFDISNRPEILATIYNIGFAHSKPNSDPQMGGAPLNIAGQTYSFGRIAYDFYYSGELLDAFPQ